jgi:hypothetical protein
VAWDRIAIACYPSRASFFAMQDREDFQKQYVHKEAGMETTIVMGCVPVSAAEPDEACSDPLVMRVRRFAEGQAPGPDPDGVTPVARFDVDGVILGDGRTWDDVRFDRMDGIAIAALARSEGVVDQVMVVIDPLIEDLIGSIRTFGG